VDSTPSWSAEFCQQLPAAGDPSQMLDSALILESHFFVCYLAKRRFIEAEGAAHLIRINSQHVEIDSDAGS
jgi:hypothetical protein